MTQHKDYKKTRWYNRKSTKFHVFNRDDWKCIACNSAENLTFDHNVPKSRGGRRNYLNGLTLCQKCNCAKGNRTLDEWIEADFKPNYRKAMNYATQPG